MNFEERFWSKVDKKETNQCWDWKAAKNRKGYGQFRLNGILWIAHRLSYTLANGVFNKTLCVLHSCDNPKCVNPGHLRLGTYDDNNKERALKGRSANTSGSKNGHSKLKEDQVTSIRELYLTGKYSYSFLGKQFNVDKSLILLIVKNKIWRHI